MKEVNIEFSKDIFKESKDRFYIFQNEEGHGFVIASYNVKTDCLMLKNASNNVLCDGYMKEFVEYSKKKATDK